jgi:hypothetical protein
MPYRIAGIDVHKKVLAVVVSDVEVDCPYRKLRLVPSPAFRGPCYMALCILVISNVLLVLARHNQGDATLLMDSLERVQSAASRILDGMSEREPATSGD